jgi:hypothetical protein
VACCLPHAGVLLCLVFCPDDREDVPPKCQLTFTELHSIISQMIELLENGMTSKWLWALTSHDRSCCECYLWSSLKKNILSLPNPSKIKWNVYLHQVKWFCLWYWFIYIAESSYRCITVCAAGVQLSNSVPFAIQTASKYTTYGLRFSQQRLSRFTDFWDVTLWNLSSGLHIGFMASHPKRQ